MPNPLDLPGSSRRARVALIASAALLVATTTVGLSLRVWHSYLDLHVYRTGARVFLDGDFLYGVMPPVDGVYLPFTYPRWRRCCSPRSR